MAKKYMEVPFEVKAEDIQEDGTFTGYASVFGGKPDSYGDIVSKGAFTETLAHGGRNKTGVAMLWQHNETAGVWLDLKENTVGLKVTGKIEKDSDIGLHRYNLMKMGAVKGLSIGWDFLRDENGKRVENAVKYDDEKGVRYLKQIELWEISPVTFPAATSATINNVKTAVEMAANERELEVALRDSGLSKKVAQYIVGLCKNGLFERVKEAEEKEDSNVCSILEELKKTNEKIVVK
jgi:HK97 family phage prohead protease